MSVFNVMSLINPFPPSQYWNQETVDLANNLLPMLLKNKTKIEIALILDNPDNQNLVNILKQFCNQTYKAQIQRNRGLTFGYYQVLWDSVGNVRQIDVRNMCNLNYLLFTDVNAYNSSNFIFAVLYVVNVNLRNYLKQTLNSQGLSYCSYQVDTPSV